MIAILPSVLLFALCLILFIRDVKLERERFLEKERLDDEHILREVERFVTKMKQKNNLGAA